MKMVDSYLESNPFPAVAATKVRCCLWVFRQTRIDVIAPATSSLLTHPPNLLLSAILFVERERENNVNFKSIQSENNWSSII